MEKKTQFSIWYFAFAFALLSVFFVHNAWLGARSTVARKSLLRQSAAQLLGRETLGESDLERIRAIAVEPAVPLPKAA